MSGDVVEELRGLAQDVQTSSFWRGSEGGEAGEALAAFFTKTADLITQLTKERDAALDNDWVAAPAYAAKVEQCRRHRTRAETAERLLAEARAALEWSARLFDGIRSAVETNQVVDKDVHGTAISGRDAARTAARTLTNGGENGR